MPLSIRQKMLEKGGGHEKDFLWRGGDVSRIESLSDGVFAFALTLLVVSLSVPSTFDALIQSMLGFFSFAACFALLTLIWYSHYKFFRRYGLEDRFTIVFNTVLLFVVLFYIYPLKFLATFLIDGLLGGRGGHAVAQFTRDEGRALMMIYSVGFIALFGIVALLYRHAYHQREELELDALEVYQTQTSIQENLVYVAVGACSIGLAALARWWVILLPLSGFVYFALGPVFWIHGRRRGRGFKRMKAALEAPPADPELTV